MAKTGYVDSIYGRQFNIAVANASGQAVMSASGLPSNAIVIAAQVDSYTDTGIYSMICTDSSGMPMRLTYSLMLQDGLTTVDASNDAVGVIIDNGTIKADQALRVDIAYMIDGTTLKMNSDGSITVDEESLSIATDTSLGVVKIDDDTIHSSNGYIYVNTDALAFSHNGSMTYGILHADGETCMMNLGVMTMRTDGLAHADESTYGVCVRRDWSTDYQDNPVAVDENYTFSIDNDALRKCRDDQYGIAKPYDNGTMMITQEDVLAVNVDALQKADNWNYGVVKIDSYSLITNDDGRLTVNHYDEIFDTLTYTSTGMKQVESDLSYIESFLAQFK